ncbi:Putative rRNA methylase [Caminicella sporogenes DSM 14501]|uniref:Putative rRNA methylase n=1 Tax=Caminicella sporogenes DSM 14501 TaxID=1121266 RepID=A0A1M6L4H6_9FIRM|nr:class I SAM-dependent methyltransferase [Caminicella sporogenes]RKD27698.1 16S rRNA (cytosine(1402)-N(4))-methyltransferase [Caminicella sporogenes]SHJ65979.1 Putative rRNA methylase [Caminicella sporogenes DSM 14501]
MQAIYLNKATQLAKDIIKKVVKSGDVVVDATIGNGNDTVFLCNLVGDSGKVYGFDIQKKAVMTTIKKLEMENVIDRAVIIEDGHENIDKYVKEEVSAIMFNLGYLPKADHNITTKYNTTIEAIKKGIKVLKLNGVMTIVVYPGHKEGFEEKIKLLEFLEKIDQKYINVLKLEFINQINNPPFVLALEKKSKDVVF